MKTYLITGGAGFIGSNFILYMINKYDDIRIINLDKLTYAGNLENLRTIENNSNYIFVQGDVCNKVLVEELFEKYDIDYVVNFAAESHVDRSIKEPEVFIKTNVLGTVTLLNAAKNSWQTGSGFKQGRKYLQVSTDEVYGSLGEKGFFVETTPLDSHSPYSSSKAGADLLVKSYFDTYKMPINITRCSNNYGPYQFPEKLIPLLIRNCLNHKHLPIYGDGLNVRDWLYVEDHCKAIDMTVNEGRWGEIYNIGGHNERTNIQIVKTIIGYINGNVDKDVTENLIKYVEDRKGHDRRYGIDATKIKNELGWYPETAFEIGIKKTMNWYLSNQEWLKKTASNEITRHYNCNLLVSINCITYNHEDYIADAIESFLMQKTNFGFEILIHDDASTDKTTEIIKEYAKKYPNIVKPIFQVENQYSKGRKMVGDISNHERARGKYIALCDGDDYWTDPYKLQKQIDYMENHPDCSMCFHAAELVYPNKKIIGKQQKPYDKNCVCSTADIIIGGGSFCATSSFMYPKKLVENLPEFYIEAHVGDYPLQLFLATKGYVYYINEIMSAYRIGVKGSWTKKNFYSGNIKEKTITYHKNNIKILNEFNIYTNQKYSDIIDKTKLTYEFQILISEQKIKELKNSRYKIYYNEIGGIGKIKLHAKCYFPNIYRKLTYLKRNVKELLSNLSNNY